MAINTKGKRKYYKFLLREKYDKIKYMKRECYFYVMGDLS